MLTKPTLRKFFKVAASAGWIAAVSSLFVALARYETTAGAAANSKNAWPASAPVALDAHRPTLLMFAHPSCPCTAASLEEFCGIASRAGPKLSTHLFFYTDRRAGLGPESAASNWPELINRLHNIQIHADERGASAALFGAKTSGHAFLYHSTGKLIFNGGLTPSRGASGRNPGSDALARAVLLGEIPQIDTPVFGCAISR